MPQPRPGPPGLPRTVWTLGMVSLLMDVSSEMIHSLLPMFLATTLALSATTIGLLEGVAEATALIVKVFSGTLSDWLGRRKGLALAGYALGALSKPLFALATGPGLVVVARLIDRTGKGLRGAPRDALLADVTPPTVRGAAFGLRQALDTAGACLGPLLAAVFMLAWANDFRAVFWLAVVPGSLAVALLALGVQEPARPASGSRSHPFRRESLEQLGAPYGWVVAIGTLFALARFSEAFLVLRAQQLGVAVALVPLVMVAMNAVYALSAYPFGRWADRMPHTALLAASLVMLIAADLALGAAQGLVGLLAGVALWGLHLGLSQGLLAAMVADAAPAALRGTAYGLFNLASGAALLAASAVAGVLWDRWGPATTFHAGAGFAALCLVVLGYHRRRAHGAAP